MPNRILKETIWTSPNLNSISVEAEWLFYRLIPAPDDSGCFEATPLVVKGKCFPLRDKIKVSDIEKWYSELETADLIRFWSDNGRQFGFFTHWEKHQRIRSVHQRKTPIPPNAVICRQVSANDGLNPNPNPNPNPNLKTHICASDDARFGVFWEAYPKKKSKPEALKAWAKIKNKEETLNLILNALEWQKISDSWVREGGQFIPFPQKYLNQRRWEDEPDGNQKTRSAVDEGLARFLASEDEPGRD